MVCMLKKLPIVAIIGQTNAGKSALFNRLVGRKDAIVAREAGTTRDSVVRTVDDSFILVDTAGLKDPKDDFEATIQDQVDDAIASANLILLVKDITEYPEQTDRDIAKKALRSKKPVILVLNKADLKEKISPDEYLRLGIKDISVISAEHNQGIAKLRNTIVKTLTPDFHGESSRRSVRNEPFPDNLSKNSLSSVSTSLSPHGAPDKNSRKLYSENWSDEAGKSGVDDIKLALIGRPNVGKSHLFNTLSQKQQAIVAPVAGTTRDVNRTKIKYHDQTIELLDTAGVRRRGKIEQGIEKFSVLRTVAAIEESDICLLLMDVNEPNTSVDQSLAGMITEAGKGIIIVITKWDVVADDQSADHILHQIATTFDFIPYAPVILTSSVTGKNVTQIFKLATEIVARRQTVIPTRKLNDMLSKAVLRHPPAGLKNTLPKMRYIVQTDTNPPWFVIYGANFKHIHWSYKRYLERQTREAFDLAGTPIKFSFRDQSTFPDRKSATRC